MEGQITFRLPVLLGYPPRGDISLNPGAITSRYRLKDPLQKPQARALPLVPDIPGVVVARSAPRDWRSNPADCYDVVIERHRLLSIRNALRLSLSCQYAASRGVVFDLRTFYHRQAGACARPTSLEDGTCKTTWPGVTFIRYRPCSIIGVRSACGRVRTGWNTVTPSRSGAIEGSTPNAALWPGVIVHRGCWRALSASVATLKVLRATRGFRHSR